MCAAHQMTSARPGPPPCPAVKMITGDHAATALAIGKMLGIAGGGLTLTGPEVVGTPQSPNTTPLALAFRHRQLLGRPRGSVSSPNTIMHEQKGTQSILPLAGQSCNRLPLSITPCGGALYKPLTSAAIPSQLSLPS